MNGIATIKALLRGRTGDAEGLLSRRLPPGGRARSRRYLAAPRRGPGRRGGGPRLRELEAEILAQLARVRLPPG
jgi:hypothetical protein